MAAKQKVKKKCTAKISTLGLGRLSSILLNGAFLTNNSLLQIGKRTYRHLVEEI